MLRGIWIYKHILNIKYVILRDHTTSDMKKQHQVQITNIQYVIFKYNNKIFFDWMVMMLPCKEGYTIPGATWANERKVWYESCPKCIIDRLTSWPAVQHTTTMAAPN